MKTLKFILIIALLSSCSITRNTTNKHYSVSKESNSFAKKERTGKLKHVKHRSKLPLSYRIGLFINNLRNN